jgi:serine/threonine protein kinase
MEDSAADSLLGFTLKSGWKVIEKITNTANSTGSFFSICYKVEKGGTICFLKAFNFMPFFHLSEQNNPGRPAVDVLGDMINAYRYERDLSMHCKSKHVTKVVFVIDAGEETVTSFSISTVPYLIFELADGDVRNKLNFSDKLDFAWKLHSLHDIAVGLEQLHNINVSHQDLKPSNILIFKQDSKLGDLGRSMCKDIDNQYNKLPYSGDFTYAPPEIMYRYFDADWNKRVFATDCYLLGSMIVFYFAGISMSALLLKYLPENLRWEKWRGTFDEIKSYLVEAFQKAIIEFGVSIEGKYFKKEISQLVEQLCFPLPEQRGHPKNIASKHISNFSLERFISKLNLLAEKAEFEVKR